MALRGNSHSSQFHWTVDRQARKTAPTSVRLLQPQAWPHPATTRFASVRPTFVGFGWTLLWALVVDFLLPILPSTEPIFRPLSLPTPSSVLLRLALMMILVGFWHVSIEACPIVVIFPRCDHWRLHHWHFHLFLPRKCGVPNHLWDQYRTTQFVLWSTKEPWK